MTQADGASPKKKATKSKSSKKKASDAAKKTSKTKANAAPSKTKSEKPAKNKKTAAEEKNAAKAPPRNEGANGADHRPLYEDFDALSEYLTNVSGKSQDMIREFFVNQNFQRAASDMGQDPLNVGEAFQEVMKGLSADPGVVLQRQFNLWGDYAKLMATMSRRMAGETVKPAIAPAIGDKRFSHPAWEENPMLDFMKQSYLIFGQWLTKTVEQLEGLDDHEKKKAEFYTAQFVDAFSPTNFAMLNPEVVQETIESKGENLLKGLQNLLEDIDRGHGELAIRQADLDHFKLGENIATTPGKVIFQNDIIQLIQYAPKTETVAKTPLLICPPWINKFYILDLQPANSFIKWAVEQGRTVFLVSWVNPGPALKGKTFEDYIHEGLFASLDTIKRATGEEKVDTIGYCIGGTMLATALALMAQNGDKRINSATFFTAQTDFKESGDLLLFVDDEQLDAIEKQMDAAGGVLEGRAMATTFNMLRSNDLIWSFVIDNYMKGKNPAKFDLLYWNSDATRMPKKVHLFYLREYYQHNRLAAGEMVMKGKTLDLSRVDIPVFMQAGETDHIAPANSVYRSARLFGGDNVQYMLAGSGHIAGVVNHPDKHKYHHSINMALPETLDEWKQDAERYEGSWWPYWIKWLNGVSEGEVPAREPGDGAVGVIEDAPGSYVAVKS
ncbi:MAG: class I poly(R)-hydroxyalkanoic acid synthase [Pseudomonadota bacterium]